MTQGHLQELLNAAQAAPTSEGWQAMSQGRLLTLYAARDSVGLTVARIEAVKLADTFLYARTQKGEMYVVRVDDVFAGSVEGVETAKRKAGFV